MEKGKNKKKIAAGLLIMSLTMACNSALAPILAEVGNLSGCRVTRQFRLFLH